MSHMHPKHEHKDSTTPTLAPEKGAVLAYNKQRTKQTCQPQITCLST